MRSSYVEVDLEALRKNAAYLRQKLSPGARLLCAVKGDAYGHGLVECSRVLAQCGADFFGVALAEEGVQLRQAGISTPILVFGYTFSDNYDLLFNYDLRPNVFTLEQALELNALAGQRGVRLSVHLSVDTGLTRLGFTLNEATPALFKRIAELPHLFVEGLFSQFATVDLYPERSFIDLQLRRFLDLCKTLEGMGVRIPIRHICDSAATLLLPEAHLDMVRPGTSLFGMYCCEAFEHMPGAVVYPTMALKSRLAMVRPIPAGTPVSYNSTWVSPRSGVLGVVPCGFVDGISRIASNQGFVLLHGRRCPIVGNVCMDQFMIDITGIDQPRVGDEIVLVGAQGSEEITLAEAAGWAGTSDTELAARFGKRLPRIYLNQSDAASVQGSSDSMRDGG